MQPSCIHYICAHISKITRIGGAIGFCVFILTRCHISIEALASPMILLLLLLVLISALPLGWMLSAVVLEPFTFKLSSMINGAPFSKGNYVQVLIGDHKNNIGRICDIWTSRGTVCVDLVNIDGQEIVKYYSYNEVLRIVAPDISESRPKSEGLEQR